MACDRRGQLPRFIKPMRLNSSHTTLRAPRTAMEHRPQNLITEESEHVDGLEELSSQCPGRSVVEPDPCSGLKPVRVQVRPGNVRTIQPLLDSLLFARPEDHGTLNALVQIRHGDEF